MAEKRENLGGGVGVVAEKRENLGGGVGRVGVSFENNSRLDKGSWEDSFRAKTLMILVWLFPQPLPAVNPFL